MRSRGPRSQHPRSRSAWRRQRPPLLGAYVKETFRSASPLVPYDDVLVDARGVVWRPHKPVEGTGAARYTVAFNGTGSSWLGGRILGIGKSSSTAPSGVAVATEHATSDTALYLLNVTDTLNGVWIGRQTFDLKLGNVWFSNIKDTCIVADHDEISWSITCSCKTARVWSSGSASHPTVH